MSDERGELLMWWFYLLCVCRKSLRWGPPRPIGSSGNMNRSPANTYCSKLKNKQTIPSSRRSALELCLIVHVPDFFPPSLDDVFPRRRFVHKISHVVIGHDHAIRLLSQVEHKPVKREIVLTTKRFQSRSFIILLRSKIYSASTMLIIWIDLF